MSDVVIVGAKRTAIGSFLGQFTGVPTPTLGTAVIAGALEHAGLAADQVDEVIMPASSARFAHRAKAARLINAKPGGSAVATSAPILLSVSVIRALASPPNIKNASSVLLNKWIVPMPANSKAQG